MKASKTREVQITRDLEKHVDLISKPEIKQKIKFNIFEKEEKKKNKVQTKKITKMDEEDLSVE